MRDGYPMGCRGLTDALGDVVNELAFHDLAEMGASTTPPALAAWFFERLASQSSTLMEVSVWNEIERGTVNR